MRPRVAIPVPTSADLAYNDRNWSAFADAVTASGGEPVRIPLDISPKQIAELANTCQAICLPGSPADVNPEKYGQERLPATAPADLPRENVDELLLQDAHNLYKPILAICYGAQILNVWRSGTLIQDLTILPVNHTAGPSVATAHTAVIAPDSLLASVLVEALPAESLRLPINSSHHQAIGIPGDGLRVSARCPQDGVVEAIEGGQFNSRHAPNGEGATENGPGSSDYTAAANSGSSHPAHFVLGIQWHPERNFATDPASQAVFHRLIREAAAWKPRAVLTSVA